MTHVVETSRITLRVPGKLKAWLGKTSEGRGISQNAQIILSLEAQMQSDDAEQAAQEEAKS